MSETAHEWTTWGQQPPTEGKGPNRKAVVITLVVLAFLVAAVAVFGVVLADPAGAAGGCGGG